MEDLFRCNSFRTAYDITLPEDRVYIIAEAGVNHDGKIAKAKRLINIAADAKADAVKFQTFDPDQSSRIKPRLRSIRSAPVPKVRKI